MQFEQIQKIVNDHIDLVEISSTGLAQGKDRAAKFLVVQSILANYIKDLEDGRAKGKTIVDASYAQVLREISATSKKITEAKKEVEAHPDYTSNREALEQLDSEINWVKTHMKIFDNAHLMFRQYSRE